MSSLKVRIVVNLGEVNKEAINKFVNWATSDARDSLRDVDPSGTVEKFVKNLFTDGSYNWAKEVIDLTVVLVTKALSTEEIGFDEHVFERSTVWAAVALATLIAEEQRNDKIVASADFSLGDDSGSTGYFYVDSDGQYDIVSIHDLWMAYADSRDLY